MALANEVHAEMEALQLVARTVLVHGISKAVSFLPSFSMDQQSEANVSSGMLSEASTRSLNLRSTQV